jgi:hypothetical protein
MTPDDLTGKARERYDTWRTLGLSEASALRQVIADGDVVLDPFDASVDLFRRLGMSETAARHAAIGRTSGEGEARRVLAEARRRPVTDAAVHRVAGTLRRLTADGKTSLKAAEAKVRGMDPAGEWSDVIDAAVRATETAPRPVPAKSPSLRATIEKAKLVEANLRVRNGRTR